MFAEVQVRQGEQGSPNCTPFVIPKNDIKASMILDCTPGNAADPEPPPHFILASWTALGEWLQVYGGGDLCMTHVDLSNAFWSFLPPAGTALQDRDVYAATDIVLGRVGRVWQIWYVLLPGAP